MEKKASELHHRILQQPKKWGNSGTSENVGEGGAKNRMIVWKSVYDALPTTFLHSDSSTISLKFWSLVRLKQKHSGPRGTSEFEGRSNLMKMKLNKSLLTECGDCLSFSTTRISECWQPDSILAESPLESMTCQEDCLKYWCFQFFVFGDHSVHCTMFSSIPAPYTLDTSSTPAPVVTTNNVSRHGNVPGRGGVMDIAPVEKHWPIAMLTGKQPCPWGSIQLCSAFLLNISRQPKFTRYSRKNEEKKLLGGNRL